MAHTLKEPPARSDEARRLAALARYRLLDTPSEELFDSLARLAASICETPIALISLVDDRRQWFKANVGLPGVSETVREIAFCGHTIAQPGLFEIADATADERFSDNPLVVSDPHVRFYAGVPLRTRTGEAIGTVCVLDHVPRELSAAQRTALRGIGDAIFEQFEARRATLQLFDSSQIELFHLDLPTGDLLFASDAAHRNLGYGETELAGAPAALVFPALDLARELERRFEAQSDAVVTTLALRRDGTTYPIEMRAELLVQRNRRIALLFGRDLTETQSVQERLDLLSTAIEAAQDAIIIATPGESADEPSRIIYVNAAFLAQKGWSLDEVIGRPADRFLGSKTDRSRLREMRAALMAGNPARIEYITYRKNGTSYPCEVAARPLVDAAGVTTHFVVVQRDMTDSVMRGLRLELQNERLIALTSIARGLFAALDPRALNDALVAGVYELTGGAGTIYGVRPEGGVVATLDFSLPMAGDADDPFPLAASRGDVTEVSADARRVGVRILGPAGNTAYVLVVAGDEPFVKADVFALGLLGQYVGVALRNVELYGELASRRTAVIELNQVKNDLIAMLAHDFKGPLTTIVGFADLLAEDNRFDAESRQFLGMISSSAMRLASLATDTLALSRLEQNELMLELGQVDLIPLVRDVTRVFSVTRSIELRAPGGVLAVGGDGSRLRQVFENLIGNAIKYSPGGEAVHVTLAEKRGGVEVAVRDRGIGVPAADLPKLFGRFARATNARELGIGGTGFGLYLSRSIVELHGGTIGIESNEAGGSTFRVFLPATPPRRRRNRRVLLLDADGDVRSYVAHTLRDDGDSVFVVTDERAALAALGEGVYDAAIVDVDCLTISPDDFVGAAGTTALVHLGTPTSLIDGWHAVLGKPFLIKDLQAAVETAIARRVASVAGDRAAPPEKVSHAIQLGPRSDRQ